ncbi:WD40 repeat-like protein [Gloeophyllum trabeum ATCC 11539]|uniref:WD40 repeat-like protein n=1 Tax=Gloeophyllum trabeum (strain ATCC 11539 / FP-39264 / Madison 617) TaxID=670483 RepID=S7RNP7_GLOTA|nr:WD40 repeat-like protein [Gloeophyllum trabeum ATCC 11539]EPQ56130.1 WD40 repeat-like protein [Gloeophyllum trabeum ATCC 11539]
MPIASPPTPAPSPRPSLSSLVSATQTCPRYAFSSLQEFSTLGPADRLQYLQAILGECNASELLFISTTIAPLLKRDFLRDLPIEIALHILSYITDAKTLARASQVSKHWNRLLADEWIWKRMCDEHDFQPELDARDHRRVRAPRSESYEDDLTSLRAGLSSAPPPHLSPPQYAYRKHFKVAYTTMKAWRRGGHLLRAHRIPIATPDNGVVTSVAMDLEWVVVGLANSRIYVFSAKTGMLSRTLIGHESGVWAVNLVSRGGRWGGPAERESDPRGRWEGEEESRRDTAEGMGVGAGDGMRSGRPGLDQFVPPSLRSALGLDNVNRPRDDEEEEEPKLSDVLSASEGWGQANALVVSGGCDKVVRVWDAKTGYCIYVLHGHTSTIRCIKVLHHRPIAVSGSRDCTLRVWDVQRGRMLRVLQGHQQSVRCLDVYGNKVVSGSYDCTCRLWNIDTGECLYVLRGHYHQIYSVAFDGVRIASGGLDTSVRVWDASTGECIALLQGHTALVCQLQLSRNLLATGGSDGRVITFSITPPTPPATGSNPTFAIQHRINAHDSSVTALQFNDNLLVTGGNDGRVRLFEMKTGKPIRELSDPCECVWKVAFRKDVCAIMCKRAGKTVMEFWSFRPRDIDES